MFVEGRQVWLIDRIVLLEKNQPFLVLFLSPGSSSHPPCDVHPISPTSQAEFPPTAMKCLKSNLFLVTER